MPHKASNNRPPPWTICRRCRPPTPPPTPSLALMYKEDHTSSEAPTTRSDHVRSSDKEGGGIGGDRGRSRQVRVSEVVVLAVSIGGE
eukprot:scaffold120755_cov27-Attheya_sp.AAC.1